MPSLHGIGSKPSSSRAFDESARACHSRKWSWPRLSSGGRRIAADTAAPTTASPLAIGTGSVRGTRPRPAESTAAWQISRVVANPFASR